MSKLELDHTLDELALAYLAGTATYAECQSKVKMLREAAFKTAKLTGADDDVADDARMWVVILYDEKVEYHHYRLAKLELDAKLKADRASYHID